MLLFASLCARSEAKRLIGSKRRSVRALQSRRRFELAGGGQAKSAKAAIAALVDFALVSDFVHACHPGPLGVSPTNQAPGCAFAFYFVIFATSSFAGLVSDSTLSLYVHL